jgi:predicted transcriptional regulator
MDDASQTEPTLAWAKWKEVTSQGMTSLPTLLFVAQAELGLKPTQLNVLLQLLSFWYTPERKPFPRKSVIAARTGLTERQVQRTIASLKKTGFLETKEMKLDHGGIISNEYDLSGLVEKLRRIAAKNSPNFEGRPQWAPSGRAERFRRKPTEPKTKTELDVLLQELVGLGGLDPRRRHNPRTVRAWLNQGATPDTLRAAFREIGSRPHLPQILTLGYFDALVQIRIDDQRRAQDRS